MQEPLAQIQTIEETIQSLMLRKGDISPFQGFLSLARSLVGALPRPIVSDAFSVNLRKGLSLKGTNTVAEGNALGNKTDQRS